MRFLLWLVVLCWALALLWRAAMWLLRGVFHSLTERAAPPNRDSSIASRRLVRDPVCGVHVAEERAITWQTSGEVVHFCSAECRDRYAGKEQKFAANS